MIELSASSAFLIYLGFTLAALLGMWCAHHWKSARRHVEVSETQLLLCEYCGFTYLEDPSASVTRCPQCHSLNSQNRYRPPS